MEHEGLWGMLMIHIEKVGIQNVRQGAVKNESVAREAVAPPLAGNDQIMRNFWQEKEG